MVSILTAQEPMKVETAAKGRVLSVQGEYLQVDFSEYARKQQYIGHYEDVRVLESDCIKNEN